jgi:DNA-binding PadR family transcriptional regulator
MYATLKRLEEKDLLIASIPGKGLVASRRILSPTSAGKSCFESWLTSPSPCRPRTLRLEFLTRLYFASRLAPDTVPTMIEDQRNSMLRSLQRMQEKLQKPGKQNPAARGLDIKNLADDFTIAQLRSALEWIDAHIIPAIQGDTQ